LFTRRANLVRVKRRAGSLGSTAEANTLNVLAALHYEQRRLGSIRSESRTSSVASVDDGQRTQNRHIRNALRTRAVTMHQA